MLTILLCRDQSAGTDAVLEQIAADVSARRGNRILMVPELISHDVERRLCKVAGDTASRYAEVLSFTRLARRVEEMVGSGAEECLDNGGRMVAMAAAAISLHSQLKAYAAVETKPEFLTELVDAVDEFKRCCISAADLKEAGKNTSGSLAQKLFELSLILESYDALCSQGKRDPRDRMNWVLEQLEDMEFAGEHVFYIDGFPDFTRQHMDIIALLIRMSPSVTVCLNCDAVDSTNMAFEKAGQTARQLVDAAKKANIPVEIRRLSEEEGALQEIRSLVFQGNIVSKPEMAEKLELIRCESAYQECQVAAQKVFDLVSNGCRYRDIAVVCSQMPTYRALLHLAFRNCAIPLYLAGTDEVLQSSVIMTVLFALDAALGGMEQQDVLRYLRSAASPLLLEECDLIENYAVVWGISGKRWLEEWTGHPEGLSGRWNQGAYDLLAQVNRIRHRAMEPLEQLRLALKRAVCLKDQITALYHFLEQIGYAARLSALAETMELNGDRRGAQVLGQLWEILISALEQMYDVLGDTFWVDDAFPRLLRLLLSQYDVGTIPPVLDAVTAGDVSSMRCTRAKHVIILGANEGSFPGYSGSSGLLTDQERVELRRIGVPLTGGSLDGLQSEFAEIYGVLCGAREKIIMSCSEEPSFIFRRLSQMAGREHTASAQFTAETVDQTAAAAYLVSQQRENDAKRMGIADAYDKIHAAVSYDMGDVTPNNIQKLYGSTLNLSASQVDKQAECRLSYFLQYGLRAKERKEATVDPAEFGTYVHSVLELTARDVMAMGGFRNVDLETTLQIADGHSKAYAQEHFSQLDSQRMEYLFRRNMQELELVVQELWRELHDAQYAPERFELHFAVDGEMPAIEIPGTMIPAALRGFVDRVDLWQHAGANYVRVVDYKTGKKDFDYCDVFNGVGLQMLLYLFALEEQGSAITGETAIPAGVQYFPARVPYVSAESANDDSWLKLRQKQWVRKGLLLNDEASLQAMDPTEGMDTLNCKRTKDGTVSGDVVDRSQMIMLKKYVMRILQKMVNSIASGNVQPNPYTRGSSHNACTFCPYGAVCHKDTVAGRRDYQAMSAQRFWEDVEKELNSHG